MRMMIALKPLLVLGLSLASTAAAATLSPRSTTSVMVVGDSMTQGREGDWTWRYRLWQWFVSQNVAVTFVGPYTGTYTSDPPTPPQPPPLYGSTPAAAAPRVLGGYASGTTAGWPSAHFALWGQDLVQDVSLIQGMVAQYQPQYLLVMLGSNDLGWLFSNATVLLANMEAFIANARAANPNIKLVIANVPQRTLISGRSDLVLNTILYNTQLAIALPALSTTASPIALVDLQDLYNCNPTSCPAGYDGMHPNATGEYQIAQAFSQTLVSKFALGTTALVIPSAIPVRPCPVPTNVVATTVPEGIELSWTPVYGALGYDIQWRFVGQTAWSLSSGTAYAFYSTWIFDGQSMEYQVRTSNGDTVKSAWSASVTGIAHPQVCASPTSIIVAPAAGGAIVSWGTPTGTYCNTISSYEVITWDQSIPGAYIDAVGSAGTTLGIQGLITGHIYEVFVATWNANGGSVPSAGNPFLVGATQPAVPTNVQVITIDATTVNVTWDAAAGAAGYKTWVSSINSPTNYTLDGTASVGLSHGIAYLYPGIWNFEFCVSSVNGFFESAKSVCITPPKCCGF